MVEIQARDPKGLWYDFEVLGELYRWVPAKNIVIGPDGAEYDADFWSAEWGVDMHFEIGKEVD